MYYDVACEGLVEVRDRLFIDNEPCTGNCGRIEVG